MMQKNKILFNLLSVFTLIYLFIYSFQDNLFESNLSRIANTSIKGYFLFIVLSLLIGLIFFISMRKQRLNKYALISLLSVLIGGIIPYDYLQVGSLASNLHLIFAYISLGLTLLCLTISLFTFEIKKPKINIVFKYCLAIIACLTIYQYGYRMFINTFIELIYLSFIIISQTVIVNVL